MTNTPLDIYKSQHAVKKAQKNIKTLKLLIPKRDPQRVEGMEINSKCVAVSGTQTTTFKIIFAKINAFALHIVACTRYWVTMVKHTDLDELDELNIFVL